MSRRRLLVPEARQALQELKLDVQREMKLTEGSMRTDVDPLGSTHDKGAWTTSEAGEKGGAVGGEMVKRLIEIAKEEKAEKTKRT